jgi:hypothetical protein
LRIAREAEITQRREEKADLGTGVERVPVEGGLFILCIRQILSYIREHGLWEQAEGEYLSEWLSLRCRRWRVKHPLPDLSSAPTRVVYVGGASKQQLLARLEEAGVGLNEAARILFSSEKFTTLSTRQPLATVEVTVRDFGFTQGATFQELCNQAAALGLCLPPLELAPHLRLQYQDQPEGYWGHPLTAHRAPPGSIMVASAPLSADDEFPKGFYLRRIQGTLWLRGYWTSADNRWDPDDHLLFCSPVPGEPNL